MSDSISIYQRSKRGIYINYSEIYSSCDFFRNNRGKNVIVLFTSQKITITIANICYEGKTHKLTDRNIGVAIVISHDLPKGKFKIDEDESNTDMVVCYFDDVL